MATEFICSIRATGGDYSTLSLWESAIQSDLTSAKTKVYSHSGIVGTVGDGATVTGSTSNATGTVKHATATQILVVIDASSPDFVSGEQMQVDASNYVTLTNAGDSAIAVAECYNDWPSGLPDSLYISGWTTNKTNNIIVRTPISERHNGTFGSGFSFKANSWNSRAFAKDGNTHVNIIGIEVFSGTSLINGAVLDVRGTNPNIDGNYGTIVDACLVDGSYSGARSFTCISSGGWSNGARIRNTIVRNGTNGINGGYNTGGNIAENCVATDCDTGFLGYAASKQLITKNCVAYTNTTNYNAYAAGTGSTNNAASDAATNTPPGSNPLTTNVQASDFVDAANDNYHLSSGSILRGAGANLSTDFTTDIDGDTRPATGAWDIGADQFVAAGTNLAIPILFGLSIAADYLGQAGMELSNSANFNTQESLEYSNTLEAFSRTSFELSSGAELQFHGTVPFGFSSSQGVPGAIPFSYSRDFSQGTIFEFSTILSLGIPCAFTFENLQSLSMPSTLLIGVLTSSSSSGALEIEWKGGLQVLSPQDIPVSWLSEKANGSSLPLSSRASIASPAEATVSYAGSFPILQAVPFSVLSDRAALAGMELSYQGSILLESPQAIPLGFGYDPSFPIKMPISWQGLGVFKSGVSAIFVEPTRLHVWTMAKKGRTWVMPKKDRTWTIPKKK